MSDLATDRAGGRILPVLRRPLPEGTWAAQSLLGARIDRNGVPHSLSVAADCPARGVA